MLYETTIRSAGCSVYFQYGGRLNVKDTALIRGGVRALIVYDDA